MSNISTNLGGRIQTLDTGHIMEGLKDNVSGANEGGRVKSLKGGKVPSHPKEVQTEGQQRLPKDNVHLRRFAAVGAGALAALRAIGALATLGISEGVVRGVRSIARNWNMQSTKDMTISVTLPQSPGRNVELDGSILPKRIPKGMTADELQKLIQDKITRGHDLLQQIKNGTHDGSPCTQKDMADIMFFLKATAQGAGDKFHEGAFSIEDPGCKIRQFLDTCPQAYQRESSHVGEFQSQEGGRHRGIDVHTLGSDLELNLPSHMKTLLYGSMQKNENLSMSGDRLFLKMETHGAFLTNPKGGGDVEGPRSRMASYHDASAILGHSLSFIATRGQGSAAGTRKERIPDNVKNGYQSLIDSAPEELKATLGKNNPLATSGGIKVMLANIAQARTQTTDQKLLDKMTYFERALNAHFSEVTDRIGNEVMISQEQMGI